MAEISERMARRILRQGVDESDEAYAQRVKAWISGDDVRAVTDLRGWTGSYPFHLDRPQRS